MSNEIVVAIISLIGVILGSLISAFATIYSSRTQTPSKSGLVYPHGYKAASPNKINYRWIGIGSLIGLISGFILAVSLKPFNSSTTINNIVTDTFISSGTPLATTISEMPTEIITLVSTSVDIPTSTVTFAQTLPSTQTPDPMPTTVLGIGSTSKSLIDNMILVYIPAGEFVMGSENGNDDEKPVHQVYLDAFWIDETEITNAMYAKCVEASQCNSPINKRTLTRPSYFDNTEFGDYPVIYVSWNDALAYCSWVGRTLPTEAQWEKAARGTEGRIYPWGDISPKNTLLNYSNSYYGDTTKVGTFPDGASAYGVLDMAGNVWEWVSSQYLPYPYYENDGREDLNSSGRRTLRGGAWNNNGNGVRSTLRGGYLPTVADNNLGFRCAKDAP